MKDVATLGLLQTGRDAPPDADACKARRATWVEPERALSPLERGTRSASWSRRRRRPSRSPSGKARPPPDSRNGDGFAAPRGSVSCRQAARSPAAKRQERAFIDSLGGLAS